jgi:hypothetical protein
MTPKVRGPVPKDQPSTEVQAAAKPPDSSILVPLVGDALDDIAAHIDGSFVVVVRVTGGRYRRRCFMTAASAERAARNALDAGHDAQIYLAELKPLWKLTGGSDA